MFGSFGPSGVLPASFRRPSPDLARMVAHVSGQPLTGHAVAAIVKRRTAAAGLPVEYRGHSLRKGLVQAARLAGVSDSRVMATTRHKSMAMLRRYQGQVGLVTQAASAGLVTQARRDQAAGGN